MPMNSDPLHGIRFFFLCILHSYTLGRDKTALVFGAWLRSKKNIWLWCFPRCPRSHGHISPWSLIWGEWFCNFYIDLLWIAKFLGNTFNSFSNSKDMSHWAGCGVQPSLGGIMESCSPLAFSGQLPAGKQQRGPGSGQFPVDLGWGRGGGCP